MWKKFKTLLDVICSSHRSDDDTVNGAVRNFFIPRLTVRFFLRLGVIVVLSVLIFSTVLLPCRISGGSMEPTVKSVGINFCWRGRYWFGRTPQRGDIVIIKYSPKVFYLKRVVALPSETVEFRNGTLFVNGAPQTEPYVKFICDWKLPPRTVAPGNYYVIGDNRSMPLETHRFGQVPAQRIIGAPLW